MAPALARNQKKPDVLRRRIGKGAPQFKRRNVGMKKYLKKHLGGGRVLQQSIEAAPSSSWEGTFTSWTTVNMTKSEICTAEFASWTILDEDMGNDSFLGECMRLFEVWCWLLEEVTVTSDRSDTKTCNTWNGLTEYHPVCDCEEQVMTVYPPVCACEEQGMAMYGMLMADEDDDDEVNVEPEAQDSHLMAALLSTKDLLPSPSAGALRALSCPDLLMTSLAALLFETRHLHYINERLALPAPPKWMAALESIREMDPPNSLVSTVSLPSGWDAVSARISSSSIFNLFSDRPASPIPSLFTIDPTGASSTASTVSVPPSFWDQSSSTVSVTGSAPQSSIVSIPSTFFIPQEVTSSTSSLFEHPSMFGGSNLSSTSTLFKDPTSAHSSSSIFSIDPSGCSTTSSSTSHLSEILSTSSSSPSFCSACQMCHDDVSESEQASYASDNSSDNSYRTISSDDSEEQLVSTMKSISPVRFCHNFCAHSPFSDSSDESIHTYTVSNASSGYETDVDSEPVVCKTATTSTSSQTEALNQIETARMLAECDDMLEKLVAMKKKLEELL